jgi:hypothetical protein
MVVAERIRGQDKSLGSGPLLVAQPLTLVLGCQRIFVIFCQARTLLKHGQFRSSSANRRPFFYVLGDWGSPSFRKLKEIQVSSKRKASLHELDRSPCLTDYAEGLVSNLG